MKEIDRLVEEVEIDIRNRGKYVPGRSSFSQSLQMDIQFKDTIQNLKNQGYDTEELERKYNKAKQNFNQQREENMLKLNQERRMRKTNLVHKVVLTASALATGIGIYTTSLGYHSNDKNFMIEGAITLTVGLGGLVYSFLRR